MFYSVVPELAAQHSVVPGTKFSVPDLAVLHSVIHELAPKYSVNLALAEFHSVFLS